MLSGYLLLRPSLLSNLGYSTSGRLGNSRVLYIKGAGCSASDGPKHTRDLLAVHIVKVGTKVVHQNQVELVSQVARHPLLSMQRSSHHLSDCLPLPHYYSYFPLSCVISLLGLRS